MKSKEICPLFEYNNVNIWGHCSYSQRLRITCIKDIGLGTPNLGSNKTSFSGFSLTRVNILEEKKIPNIICFGCDMLRSMQTSSLTSIIICLWVLLRGGKSKESNLRNIYPWDIKSRQKSECTRAESHTSWPVFRGLLKPLLVVIENYSAK